MCIGSDSSECFAADEVTFGVEGIVNGGVAGEKSLSGWWRFEPLHLSLASSNRQVRVLRAVVFSQPAWPVALLQVEFSQR